MPPDDGAMKITADKAAFGFGGLHPVSRRSLDKYKHRRRVAVGFPITKPFETKEQVDQYLAGDKIVCLVCGRSLKKLGGQHLQLHGMNDDGYRERYGIPWGRGLVSSETRQLYSDASAAAVSDRTLEALRRGREKMAASPPKYRAVCEAINKERIDRALTAIGLDMAIPPMAADEFLSRIGLGRTPREVSQDIDMPSLTWWYSQVKSRPDLKAAFHKVWSSLPFTVQARAQRLGDNFDAEVHRLFEQGLSDKKIAKALKVSAMTSNRRTKLLRCKGSP